MEMIYALIKNGFVHNCIVINELSAVELFEPLNDYVIRIDELSPVPGIGWAYDGESFTAPVVEE
jgi:hypothetical protein